MAVATAMMMTACGGEGDLAGSLPVVSEEQSSIGNVSELNIAKGDLIAVIEVKGYGTIKAKLFPDVAPIGVENFTKLANSGFYDGLNIHRVVSDFMLQGGSLNGNGTGGEAAVNDGQFGLEIDTDNARHFYGALCYANAMATNTTQFYIVNSNQPEDLSKISYDSYENYIQQLKDAAEAYADIPEAVEYYTFQANYYQTTLDVLKNTSAEIKDMYLKQGGTPSLDGNYTVFGQVYDGFDVVDKISACEVKTQDNSDEVSKPVKDIIIESVKVIEYDAEN